MRCNHVCCCASNSAARDGGLTAPPLPTTHPPPAPRPATGARGPAHAARAAQQRVGVGAVPGGVAGRQRLRAAAPPHGGRRHCGDLAHRGQWAVGSSRSSSMTLAVAWGCPAALGSLFLSLRVVLNNPCGLCATPACGGPGVAVAAPRRDAGRRRGADPRPRGAGDPGGARRAARGGALCMLCVLCALLQALPWALLWALWPGGWTVMGRWEPGGCDGVHGCGSSLLNGGWTPPAAPF